MDTNQANAAKASFSSIYEQPTPHAYYRHLGELDYSICDETRPFVVAATARLRRQRDRVRLLDIGCSYGINATTVRRDLTFAELNRLFELNVVEQPERAADQARAALAQAGEKCSIEAGGLDVSAPAVDFALRAGVLQHGIVGDLERDGAALGAEDRAWLAGVDLLLCTGAIGYVTEQTFRVVLDAMGDAAGEAIALLTVLRVFDTGPIVEELARHGLSAAPVPGVLLPQRRFQDEQEQREIVAVLSARGLDPTPELGGRHFAQLWVAAPPALLPQLIDQMRAVAATRPTLVPAPPPLSRAERARPSPAGAPAASSPRSGPRPAPPQRGTSPGTSAAP